MKRYIGVSLFLMGLSVASVARAGSDQGLMQNSAGITAAEPSKISIKQSEQQKKIVDTQKQLDLKKGKILMGGNSGGGGNTYRGRPLESYIRDPKTYAPKSFQKWEEIRDRMKYNYSEFQSSETHISKSFSWVMKKTWYFVHGPLEQISSENIGAFVSTEQVALQDFDSVWVDTDIFDKMSEEDKLRLFVHESLISMKILRFESLARQCEALELSAPTCHTAPAVKLGKLEDLQVKDYVQVRRLVGLLLNTSYLFDLKAFEGMLANDDFSNGWVQFTDTRKDLIISDEQLVQILNKFLITDIQPNNLYRTQKILKKYPDLLENGFSFAQLGPIDWRPEGICTLVKLGLENNSIQAQIDIRPTGERSYSQAFKSKELWDKGWIGGQFIVEGEKRKVRLTAANLNGNLAYAIRLRSEFKGQSPDRPTVGDIIQYLDIYLDMSFNIDAIRFSEFTTTLAYEVPGGYATKIEQRNFGMFDPLCSKRNVITLKSFYK